MVPPPWQGARPVLCLTEHLTEQLLQGTPWLWAAAPVVGVLDDYFQLFNCSTVHCPTFYFGVGCWEDCFTDLLHSPQFEMILGPWDDITLHCPSSSSSSSSSSTSECGAIEPSLTCFSKR